MSRMARVVVPHYPHHIIQIGNRRQNVFFGERDKEHYLFLLRQNTRKARIEILGYCLMDNHIHVIAVPRQANSLSRGIGETHRQYTSAINNREGWKGYLWQGRFMSYVLGGRHLCAAMRYIERNPIRAGIVQRAEDYPWSSARAHIGLEENKILSDNFLPHDLEDWSSFVNKNEESAKDLLFSKHAKTGRPLGDEHFLSELETITGRSIKKNKPGPKKYALSMVSA